MIDLHFSLWCFLVDLKVLQGSVMIGSVVIIAVLGVHKVGGPAEVLHRAIDGNRIFPPEYVKHGHKLTTI